MQKNKRSGVLIYTLGFFQNTEEYKAEGQYLMEKIASEGCHYEVSSSEDLVFSLKMLQVRSVDRNISM